MQHEKEVEAAFARLSAQLLAINNGRPNDMTKAETMVSMAVFAHGQGHANLSKHYLRQAVTELETQTAADQNKTILKKPSSKSS